MDNICHTLVGAALGRTGLGRRTALGPSTMMIGANFPDIDIVAAPFGRAIEFRRGWTHGVLALVVLPFVLAGITLLWDRYRRRPRDPGAHPAVPRELLLLSTLSIWTHPALDWMNSYGLRWLMPFDGRWFYGDSLFIIDPFLLVMLGAGVWVSRRRDRDARRNPERPARLAVAAAAGYIVMMMVLQNVAERTARIELAGTGFDRQKLVVTAFPGVPLWWRVHADDGERYRVGRVHAFERSLAMDPGALEKNANDPAVRLAMTHDSAQGFLDWARLPFYRVERTPWGATVRMTDARYGASIEVYLDRPLPSSGAQK